MRKKIMNRILAAGVAVVLTAAMIPAAGAETIKYNVPTAPTTVDPALITVSAHSQADVTPEVIGLTNTVARRNTPRGYSLEFAQKSVLIGTLGTDLNDVPNPYLYNWAYNSYAKENSLPMSDQAAIGGIGGLPNTVDTAVSEEFGGTSACLYYRPDILVGTESGDYKTLIDAMPENTDNDPSNDYNPYIEAYYYNVCDDFLTTVYNLAYDCEEIMEKDSTRRTRYGDPLEICDKLTQYDVGVQSYILKQLEENNAQKKTAAIFDPTLSTEGVFYGVSKDASTHDNAVHSRVGEFLSETTINVVDTLGKEVQDLPGSTDGKRYFPLTAEEIVENADIVVTGGLQYKGSFSEDDIRDMLIQYLNPDDTALINKAKKMPVMSSSFSTAGTIGESSIENLLGMAYWPAYCYSEYINPVYAAAYWYTHFYHVSDRAKLATVIDSTMSNASRPEGITTDISDYSDTAFQNLIDEGMAYYYTNKDTINSEQLNDMASHLVHKGNTTGKENDITNNRSASDFTDVASDAWYYGAVDYAVKNGLVAGTSDTTFSPEDPMTRGMFVTVLYRSQKRPVIINIKPFADVTESDYFYGGATWTYMHDIVKGIEEGVFGPNQNITREQIAVMFYNAARVLGKDTSASGSLAAFPDAASVDGWAADAMQWAVGSGLITGSDGQLVPLGNATRAQVAIMFQRFLALS